MVKRKKKVAVAMSGGVDSSVAAAILRDEDFDVTAVTISFDLLDGEAVENAKRVADALKIRHRIINLTDILEKKVIDNFCQEYIFGRTPNPCIRCNQYVKFGALLKRVLSLHCDFLATGHYVRKVNYKKGILLKRGVDKNKDQSYFLYQLTQNQLKRLLFPLGNLTKQQVKRIAKQLFLPVAKSGESQDVCFLRGKDYRGFLKGRIASKIKPGLITDKAGNILGFHQGIPFYTVGQREGLNIALGYRAYIIEIDSIRNQIILGKLSDVYNKELTVIKPNFILRPIKKRVVCRVKIRYNHKEAEAEILPQGDNYLVRFKNAQFAITPGQSAVFYRGDTVIGGGIIR